MVQKNKYFVGNQFLVDPIGDVFFENFYAIFDYADHSDLEKNQNFMIKSRYNGILTHEKFRSLPYKL